MLNQLMVACDDDVIPQVAIVQAYYMPLLQFHMCWKLLQLINYYTIMMQGEEHMLQTK
jgi:hypothetical protein